MTAEEFLERRFELPEAGQWSELEAGEVVHFQPPDLDHGTVVLNLSKALSEYVHSHNRGYVCFDLGLQLATEPDTVRFVAACFLDSGPRFAESDREITATVPSLVVDIASTSDRRQLQPRRTGQFLKWGVPSVWTIFPQSETVNVFQSEGEPQTLASEDWLTDAAGLPGFRMQVSKLFAEPAWWTASPSSRG